MTEITAALPRPRGLFRTLQLLVLAAGALLIAAGFLALHAATGRRHAVTTRPPAARAHPRVDEPASVAPRVAAGRWRPALDAALADDAARGLDHGLSAYSPGGATATAARVARWQPLIVRAARRSGFSPTMLEGLVMLESAGRADAIAGSDPAAAAGLTQLSVWRARHLLHMHVNLRASRRLTVLIRRAEAHGRHHRVRVLEARRRRVDRRFAPLASLRGTVRYLELARRSLGRRDLAVAAYHMGIGNVRNVVARWSRSNAPTRQLVARHHLSYAKLYFGSAPDRHARAWRKLSSLGDVTRDYYWKALAAKRIMLLYGSDYDLLAYEVRQQARKSSAEEVLHPRFATAEFRSPRAVARAWKRHKLRAIPRDAGRTHIAIGPSFGEMAHRLGRSPRLYRGLRPAARDVLLFIGRRVHELSHARQPLILTSATRDDRYQALLMRVNPNAARTYSMHTTGFAFDIARSYGSPRQAAAFEFVLDRLQALNVIAYIRESAAIHIAVSSHVSPVLLRRAA